MILPNYLPLMFLLGFYGLSRCNLAQGVALWCALLPTYLLRFAVGGIPTTALEMALYVLVLQTIFTFGLREMGRRLVVALKKHPTLWAGWILVLLGALLATTQSLDIRVSLGAFKGFFLDPCLLWLILSVGGFSAQQKKAALGALVLSGFAVAAGCLLPVAAFWTWDMRLKGFYESPNYLAMYLAPTFLLGMTLNFNEFFPARLRQKIFQRVVQCWAAGTVLWALFLTKSVGALLALIGAAVFFLLVQMREKKFLTPAAVRWMKVIVVAFLLLAVAVAYGKFDFIAHSAERSSWHSRLMIWRAAQVMLQEKMPLGIGPGTFQAEYLALQPRFEPYLEWAVPQPHNTFLAFLLQTGVVGLVGLLLILGWLFKNARGNRPLQVLLIYFLLHSLIDTLYWKNDLAMLWVIMVWMGMEKSKNPENVNVR